ncbi:MAG: PhoX family protein [Tepidisphaerales bacterium]
MNSSMSGRDGSSLSVAGGRGVSRRSMLKYVGFAAAAGAGLGPLLRPTAVRAAGVAGAGAGTAQRSLRPWLTAAGTPDFTPVRYPLPLPTQAADGLERFDVRDDVVLPEGFEYRVLCKWGDVFGRVGHRVRVGFNHDYTGLVPIAGTADEYYFIVNHEYISGRPWLEGAPAARGQTYVDESGRLAGTPLQGLELDLSTGGDDGLVAAARRLCEAAMEDLGFTVLRVRRRADGHFEVVDDADDHFAYHAATVQNVPETAERRFTGPAASLLGVPRGTFSNCSGATTPWGTFLTCEENFQDQVPEFITPAGEPLPGQDLKFRGLSAPGHDTLPFEFEGLGTGLQPPLDGRQYGWVVEVDPVRRSLVKHTRMGRFRHENVAVRAEAGRAMAAYMGDDRRGGHVWKFVSRQAVRDPSDKANGRLFEDGVLYAARFADDFTGVWVPLQPRTPLAMPQPQSMAGGFLWLPRRPEGGHVAVGTPQAVAAGRAELTAEQWVASVETFAGKPFAACTLGDLVRPRPGTDLEAVILMDAYAMANAAGATPTARPEDIEVHPHDASVYIAFTDSTGSGDGSPDARVFPDSAGKNSRQYGAIYRLAEAGNDPAATTFTWGKFVSSGEVADEGGGFACADNLVFDPAANLWVVSDITTTRHNHPVSRTADDRSLPGSGAFMGIFGNNSLFVFPTTGENAGVPYCFAIGPMECEMSGPTFTDDGLTLLLSVQHPGELYGIRKGRREERRNYVVADPGGKLFTQTRTVPLGSNFPSGKDGDVAYPCVISIVRKA